MVVIKGLIFDASLFDDLNVGGDLDVTGSAVIDTKLTSNGDIILGTSNLKLSSGYGITGNSDNIASITIGNIKVSGSDSTGHTLLLQIDSNDIITIKGTGDGSGGIINKSIGFFGTTPQTQQSHITDPTDLASCVTVLTTLLADLEGYGLIAGP